MAIIVHNNLKKVHTLSLVDRCVYKSNRRLLHFNRTSSKYLTGRKNSQELYKTSTGFVSNSPDHLCVTCKQGKRLIIIIYMYFERKQILIPPIKLFPLCSLCPYSKCQLLLNSINNTFTLNLTNTILLNVLQCKLIITWQRFHQSVSENLQHHLDSLGPERIDQHLTKQDFMKSAPTTPKFSLIFNFFNEGFP